MHRRLKVFHFVTDPVSIRPYLKVMGRRLDPQRFELSFGTLAPAGPLQQEFGALGFTVVALDGTTKRDYPRAIWRLRNWLVREQIDIVQTHLFEGALVGLAAARLARVPLAILSAHHSSELQLHQKKLALFADSIANNWLAHRIISYSTQMKELLIGDYGVRSGKISVLPFPIELAGWTRDEPYRVETRKKLGLEGKIVFGTAGRLFWIKDYDVLIRAFVGIASRWDKAALLVIGDGPDRSRLEALAHELSIGDRVVFVGHQTDLPKMMGVMDVFVHSSRAEAFCQVIPEAMSLGIPVVSTDVGVARELVEDDVTGVLVPPGDLDHLRSGLERVIEQQPLWPAMGAEARRRVERFSAAPAVVRHEAQYAAWFDGRRPRH
jgi:glycosyltransferase involved in cell wall biosynthesis